MPPRRRTSFNPNKDGLPFGGGPAETTTCPAAPSFGKTVWYDFSPATFGGVEMKIASGFDAVVAVYEWDASTSRITRSVLCQNGSAGPTEDVLLPRVAKGTNYTVQIGGVGGAGGALDFRFTFFPDRDNDDILDEQPDRCPDAQGISEFGGCPPPVRAVPRISVGAVTGGVQVVRIFVDRVSPGTRIEASCGRCGSRVVQTAKRSGSITLRRFAGRMVRSGDAISLRITQRKTSSGRYRFGAIGRITKWPIRPRGGVGSLGRQTVTCLAPGSNRRTRCP